MLVAILAPALAARASGEDGAAAPLRLRVVTFNAWGLPSPIAPRRPERMARIGPALAALAPDLVGLQEVWYDEDARAIARELAKAGLPHALRPSGTARFGSGLLLVSRFPIEEGSFHAYTLAGKPWKVWNGDFWVGKGIARARLGTPLGPLVFADTHLHARYGSDEHLGLQVTQAVEAARELSRDAAAPLILAGDLNSTPGQVPFDLLAARAGLVRPPGPPPLPVDWVLHRDGADRRVRRVSSEVVLGEEQDLGQGRRGRLSDHKGLLAVLEVAPLGSEPAPPPARVAEETLAGARALLAAEAERSRRRQKIAFALWIGLAVLARIAARPPRRPRRIALAVALALGSLLALAVAVGHEPRVEAALARAAEEIRAP